MSQQKLADAIGTSKGYISEIERNIKIPGTEILIALKRYFDVSVDWLLTGEEGVCNQSDRVNQFISGNICIIQEFKNKVEAGAFNETLKRIEEINEKKFFEALGWIKNELKNLESERGVYIGPERRSGEDRRKEDILELTPEDDRRSGIERRVAGLKS